MLKNVLKALEPVINDELKRAQIHHGKRFHSPHEGYAIIKEEMEECYEALIKAWKVLGIIWDDVRDDRDVSSLTIWNLRKCAMEIAAEAVQVASMSEKFLSSSYKWEADDE